MTYFLLFFPIYSYFFFFLSGAWVRAEPETDLTSFDDFGFFNSFDAVDATFGDVFSFLPIEAPLLEGIAISFIGLIANANITGSPQYGQSGACSCWLVPLFLYRYFLIASCVVRSDLAEQSVISIFKAWTQSHCVHYSAVVNAS